MAEKVGGRLGLSLVPSKGNWSWGGGCGISRALLASPWIVFSGQERCDIIQHERFLLLAIWSLQFC